MLSSNEVMQNKKHADNVLIAYHYYENQLAKSKRSSSSGETCLSMLSNESYGDDTSDPMLDVGELAGIGEIGEDDGVLIIKALFDDVTFV